MFWSLLLLFFFLSSLFFAPQNSSFPVNQSGSGAAHYSFTKTSRRHVEKFETTGVDYPFESEQFECEGVESRVEDVGRFIDLDFIGHDCRYGGSRSNPFWMHSPQLINPISLPFMPLKELTPTRLMFEIERVLQSHEEFVLGDDIHINLIHVKMPS